MTERRKMNGYMWKIADYVVPVLLMLLIGYMTGFTKLEERVSHVITIQNEMKSKLETVWDKVIKIETRMETIRELRGKPDRNDDRKVSR